MPSLCSSSCSMDRSCCCRPRYHQYHQHQRRRVPQLLVVNNALNALMVVVVVVLFPQPQVPPTLFVTGQPVTSIDFGTGFPCTNSGLDLNIGGRAYPQLVPTTTNCLLRLSPDQVGRAVSAFLPYRFTGPTPETAFAFNVEFTYQIFGIANGIGDGITFVIHQDDRGDDALGDGGGSLGVYGSDNIIAPALVVEMDTYINRYGLPADTTDRAIHVTIIDGSGTIFEVAEVPAPDIRNTVSNMTPVKVNLSLDGDTLRLSLNDIPRLVQTVNLNEYFTGRDVFVGFTGGSDVVADQQDILSWTMDSVSVKMGALLDNPTRTAEVRPPVPPTYAPVPMPVLSSPVTVPTTMDVSARPSAAPTTIVQYADSFWDFFIRVVRSTVQVLQDTQAALATRMMGPNDR